MSVVKRILKSDPVRNALCWLGAKYIRLAYLTGRWTILGQEIPQAFGDRNEPFIVCFWHGRLLLAPCFWPLPVMAKVLVSRHRDGQLIARAAGYLGVETIAGSTRRGGAEALRAMLRVLRDGVCVAITPDGPRGPRMRAAAGVVALARLSGAAILPGTISARRSRFLGSWDRFMLVWPFSRGHVIWGEPIRVPRDADEAQQEAARLEVENALNALTAEADRLTGVDPVEPAPAAEAAR